MSSRPTAPVSVTRTHLELRGRDALRPGRAPARPPTLERANPIGADEYLRLYRLVGGPWHWRDRLAWPPGLLDAHLESPEVQVWVATYGDDVAGYFELEARTDGATEIMYFGLAPSYIGQGLGGWLLTRACEIAFANGAPRVVLNTCTLDSERALPNYLARGFTIVREEEYVVTLDPVAGTGA